MSGETKSLKPKIVSARPLVDALQAAGIMPANCSRVIIDIPVGAVANIYFTCFGDERLLEVFQRVAPELREIETTLP